MLFNISYYPQIASSKSSNQPLVSGEMIIGLRKHFPCVEPVTQSAFRFCQGNTQGVILNSGYTEMIAPVEDLENFSECTRLVADNLYSDNIKLRGFDAFIGKCAPSSSFLGLYNNLALFLNMNWHITQTPFGMIFSARAEGMEDANG